MRSQKQLRDELRFVTEFNTLFDVVQQTAVTQMRHLEEKSARMRQLNAVLQHDFFPMLPQAIAQHPCIDGGTAGRLMVVITSDEGLVGPLHAAVIQQACSQAVLPASWLFIGQRGWRMAAGQLLEGPAQVLAMPPEERVDEQLSRINTFIMTQYRSQQLKDVWVVAPHFVSTTHQEVAVQQLLPIPLGKNRMTDERLVIEPSFDAVVGALARVWVETVLRDFYWSARRAESAARAMHVEASRQELLRHSRQVKHEFFKTIHERIDVMVRETCVVQRQVARRALAAHKSGIA